MSSTASRVTASLIRLSSCSAHFVAPGSFVSGQHSRNGSEEISKLWSGYVNNCFPPCDGRSRDVGDKSRFTPQPAERPMKAQSCEMAWFVNQLLLSVRYQHD